MRKVAVIASISLLAGCAATKPQLPTQAGVDLDKYVGTWYEQARLPNRFQKDCAGDIQADYALTPGGTISVTNQCRTADGDTKVAVGEGRMAGAAGSQDSAKLQVRFAPKWMSWLPMVWGDYWIIKLDDDYRYSLVGTPDREFLWVLSRDKQADPAQVSKLLQHAQSLGFPVDQVVRATQ